MEKQLEIVNRKLDSYEHFSKTNLKYKNKDY